MVSYVEKRRQMRSSVPMHVEVRLESGVLVEGHAINVSLNGLLFETERFLPMGSHVRVHLTHESMPHEHISCKGEVSRLDDWGMAITFDHVNPAHVETLYRYIRYTSPVAPAIKS
jgi:hypothetical protein